MGGGPGSSITLNKSVISNNSEIIRNTAPSATGAGLLNHVTVTPNKTVVSGNSAPGGLASPVNRHPRWC
jgi:hypothetical protein